MIKIKDQAYNKILYISSQLTGQALETSKIEEKQYNYELTAQYLEEKVKVLVYFGKKGISTIIQGDINSKIYTKVKGIVFGEGLFDSVSKEIEEPSEYIGTDESGKGDFFGPLVIAAVYADDNLLTKLKLAGVKDSKQLDDSAIKNISKEIKKIVPNNYRNVVIINPEKYNQLYESFKNLNKLLAWGHSKAIENIIFNNKASTVISDKFGNEELLISEVLKKNIEVNLIQTTKAERFLAVAAASILARDRMIHWFIKTGNELKVTIPKGAGDVVNITAVKIALKYGADILPKIVKLHFKNYASLSQSKKG
ncbi:MAG: ribonuclease HIII [Ignavibacterium sp.]|nr:ribonuclease HIII [Ignavibacterium sp.]